VAVVWYWEAIPPAPRQLGCPCCMVDGQPIVYEYVDTLGIWSNAYALDLLLVPLDLKACNVANARWKAFARFFFSPH